jgi:hypothetical protein
LIHTLKTNKKTIEKANMNHRFDIGSFGNVPIYIDPF